MNDNAVLINAYYDAWDEGEPSGIDRFLADDFVGHDPALAPEEFDGEGLKQRFAGLAAALPGYRLTRESVVAQDDLVVVRWLTEGTVAEAVRPDGGPVSFTGITMYRLQDGRIAELWNEWDSVTFLKAIGVVPDSAAAAS